jgi:hypothetical protein
MSPDGEAPKPILKADRDAGIITLDTETLAWGLPTEAWDCRLDRARLSTCHFRDYKGRVPSREFFGIGPAAQAPAAAAAMSAQPS